ncbi:hypothetical protein OsI_28115 [Oryza sativa Indica Group]|uniref:Uncharacterized protein n=1 Tax=Oryza sativa subsp. indica TaxID=39946 RepID=B8BBG5_ORYSI|nr:hypothetical protein OsI_28115 [Oryza sativa Indica Group]
MYKAAYSSASARLSSSSLLRFRSLTSPAPSSASPSRLLSLRARAYSRPSRGAWAAARAAAGGWSGRASSSPVVGCGACRAQIGAVAPAVERVHRRMAATAGEPP